MKAAFVFGLILVLNCISSSFGANGKWCPWKEQGCSVTCGKGVMRRTRVCECPKPSSRGLKCKGSNTEQTSECLLQTCVDKNKEVAVKPTLPSRENGSYVVGSSWRRAGIELIAGVAIACLLALCLCAKGLHCYFHVRKDESNDTNPTTGEDKEVTVVVDDLSPEQTSRKNPTFEPDA